MKDRIKQIREQAEEKKLTQSAFGERIGLTRDNVANIEGGRTEPTEIVIKSILREFNVNETWLRTGDGEMLLPKSMDDSLADFFGQVLADKPEAFRRRLAVAMSKLTEKQWQDLADIAETLLADHQEDK